MKPKFRSLIATFAPLSRTSLIVCATLSAAPSVYAADGTWTGVTSASTWGNTANWSGGVVADGSTFTADLSTADLPAGAFALGLDTNRTIQSINFGDAEVVTTAATWSLTGTTILTLSGTSPTITNSVTTTIAPVIAGTVGMTKSGSANLVLTNANTISGGISVTAGQLTTKNGAGLGANILTLGNGTTYRYERTTANATTFPSNAISLATGAAATVTTDNAGNGYSGVITGDSTSSVTIGSAASLTQCSFGNNANTQQFSGVGTVNIYPGASIRFSATSGVNNGGVSSTFTVGAGSDITTRNAATVNLGALTGVGTVTGSGGANGTAVFSIGAKGIDSTYAGVIRDAAAGRFAALTKTGAAKLTLTGVNTYTGATNVSVGTLEVGDGGSTGSIGATNVAVAANANFVSNPGTGQLQTVSGVVSGAGNVKKQGAGRTTFTGVNTYTVGPVIEGGTLAINADTGLGNAANTVSFTTGSGKLGSDAAGVVTARTMSVGTGATGGFTAIDATDSLEASGIISGDGALEVGGGSGVVRLTAANTYLGNTTVTSGTLDVGGAGSTSTGSVSVNGGVLAGTGSVTGAVSVASGAGIKPGAVTTTSSSTGTLATGQLTLAGGSTIYQEFTNASTYDVTAVTGDLLTSGASIGNPVLVDLRLENSAAKWATLGTYNLMTYTGTFSGNADDLFEVTAGSIQSGVTYTFSASGGVVTLTLSGTPPSEWNVDADGGWQTAGNWAGGIPNGSSITAVFGNIITAPRTVTLNAPATVGSVLFNNANAYSVVGSPALTMSTSSGNSGISVLAGSHSISAPLSLTNTLDLSLASPANTLTLSGIISGSGSIQNATAGAVVLTGANTFSGSVNFTGGSLTFGNGSLGAGSLSLANSSLFWTTGNTEDISNRAITLSGTSVTLDTNSNNVLLANAIGNSGAGSLIKAGLGTLTFASNPTYTGSTTISGGTLKLGTGGTTGLVSGAITDNANLSVDLTTGSTFSNLVTGTGSFVHAGTGVLTLSALNTFSGTTSISSATGSLVLTNSLNIQNSTLAYDSAGGALNVGTLTAVTLGGLSGDKAFVLENATPAAFALTIGNNGQATTYSGALGGAGSLTKIGAGISILSGLNAYTGTTVVNAGDLEVAAGTLGGSTMTTGGTGRLVISGGDLSTTTGNFAVGSNGLLVSAGNATFSGAVSAVGGTGGPSSALVKVTGGTLTMPSLALGRTGENVTYPAEPAAATADRNLYITGGAVNVTGDLMVGTASNQPNSNVITRIDGGSLTVGGALSVGLNNGGRWSILDLNGGELFSTNSTTGIVLGGPFAGNSIFLVRGGVGTVERIGFGQGAVGGNAVLKVAGGELYVGSGGVVLGSTGAFTSEFRLAGGTLGAKANWSTSLPINVAVNSTIKAANALGDPFDITLNGALTGIGGFTKTGAGTVTITGNHTYTGATLVSGGTLSVTNKSFDDSAEIYLETGGTLDLNFSGGDRVGALYLDNSLMPDGIYGKVGNTFGAIESSLITGNGLLYVNTALPVSGYDSWAATPAFGLSTGINDGPTQDPDGDGISNLLEYVLNGNPSTSDPSILPQLVVTATDFEFTYNRLDLSLADTTQSFQYGSDLSGWTPVVVPVGPGVSTVGIATVTVTDGATSDTVKVSIPKTAAVGGKLFGRLQAVK